MPFAIERDTPIAETIAELNEVCKMKRTQMHIRDRLPLPAQTVQKIAGYSTINMTDYYTRADISGMVTAIQLTADVVDELFSKLFYQNDCILQ